MINSVLPRVDYTDAEFTEDQRTLKPEKVFNSPLVTLVKPQPVEKNLEFVDDLDNVTNFTNTLLIETSSPPQGPINLPTDSTTDVKKPPQPIKQPLIKSVSPTAWLCITAGVVVALILLFFVWNKSPKNQIVEPPPAAHTTTTDKAATKKSAVKKRAAAEKASAEKTKKTTTKNAEKQRADYEVSTRMNTLPPTSTLPQVKEGKKAADAVCSELNTKLSLSKELSAKERGFYVDECK